MKKQLIALGFGSLMLFAGAITAQSESNDTKQGENVRTMEVKRSDSKVTINPTKVVVNDSKTTINDGAVNDAAAISFSEETYQFGKIEQGDKVEHTFTFKNTGETPVKLKSVKASCGCTTPTYSKEEIQPGEEGKIDVVFNSAGKMGLQMKSITVDFGGSRPAVVYLKGEVVQKGALDTQDEQ